MPLPNPLRTHEVARFINAHRIFFYTLVSLVSVSTVITNALKNYSNFYSVAIYLSKSSRSVLVLANFGLLLTLLFGHIVQRIFLGSLRPNEVERLYDRLWFFITESLLAFTIFRDEFDTPFALMFGFLLFVKSFHWLASDRIEWMDQRPYPGPPLLFHFRMTILFSVLLFTDCVMFMFAVEHTLSVGVGGMVLFASEYGILMASVTNTISKYLLSTYELRRAGRRGGENAPSWENKSMWIFYIELVTDFLKLATYLVFFIVIITFYGLPLNIIRDVYITARSFITRLRALHRYQTATRNMDQRYPNATEEELSAMSDRTCIICREEMATVQPRTHADGPNTTPKKLPCGHVFHFYCLRSWLERQQSCPTCRRNVLDIANPTVQPPPAPAALPGQAPRPNGHQNPVVPANQQNANPFGLIGRLIGLPARIGDPPANRPVVQNVVNQAPARDGAQGVLINYQIQYQFPVGNNGGNQDAAPPQRVPVPPFPGFPGPGGVWQQWPAEGDLIPPNENQTANQSEPNHSNLEGEQVEIQESSNSLDGPSANDKSLSPKEAAAQAALNRLQDKNILQTSTSSGSSKQDPNTSNEPQQKSNANIPKSIPLYDFRLQGLPSNPFNSQPSKFLPKTPLNRISISRPMSSPTTSPHPSQSSRKPQQSHSDASFSLPSDLTDEQLAYLDQLTREGIDQRLRILDGVSASVYRSINELMLLRSAIPQLPSFDIPAGNNTLADSYGNTVYEIHIQTEAEDVGLGKERMRDNLTDDSDSTSTSSNEHEAT